MILKTKQFKSSEMDGSQQVAEFVNSNNISRENIFIITQGKYGGWSSWTIFYYAEE